MPTTVTIDPATGEPGNIGDDGGRVNIAPAERVVTGALGLALAAYGITRPKEAGLFSIPAALAGGYLVYRSASGHCPAYAALRTGTDQTPSNEAQAIPHGQGLKVHRTVTIGRSPEDLYNFWRRFENLPQFMKHLVSVTEENDAQSHWVAKGPFGNVEWDAVVINDVPATLIAWKSTEGSQIPNAGSVRFTEAPAGRGTQVIVSLEYNPPAGVLGAAIAKLWGEEPKVQIKEDLRRFKNLMESGEIISTDGQPRGFGSEGGREK